MPYDRPARSRRINPAASTQRTGLRLLGGILAVTGGVFLAIGLVSFFSAFGNPAAGAPDKFWCAFVGMPMLGIGLMLLKMGYMGSIVRYVAGEAAPVASDTLNYVADETHGSVKKMASAVAAGMREPAASGSAACAACGHANDADARFCDQCGEAMQAKACDKCRKVNDHDARFCADCGKALT